MFWFLLYVFIGLMAMMITALTTPWWGKLSWKLNILDTPLGEFHKRHSRATPVLGGMAMLLGWSLTVVGGILVMELAAPILPSELGVQVPQFLTVKEILYVIIGGATMISIMGLYDDVKPLGPSLKFLLQFLICGSVAVYPQIRITLFMETPVVTWLLTVSWYLLVINALNFTDNMDGMASGLAFIGALVFTLVAALQHQFLVAALGAATSGVALGFYLHNCSPATIFMGDSGSHFLGFSLATIAIMTSFYRPADSPTLTPLLIPLFALAVPLFDAIAVIIIRLRAGKPIYHGDHNHISHRFQQMGMDKKTAVFLVHLLAMSIGIGALPLLWMETRGVILVLIQTLCILTLVTIMQIYNGKNNHHHRETASTRSDETDPQS